MHQKEDYPELHRYKLSQNSPDWKTNMRNQMQITGVGEGAPGIRGMVWGKHSIRTAWLNWKALPLQQQVQPGPLSGGPLSGPCRKSVTNFCHLANQLPTIDLYRTTIPNLFQLSYLLTFLNFRSIRNMIFYEFWWRFIPVDEVTLKFTLDFCWQNLIYNRSLISIYLSIWKVIGW